MADLTLKERLSVDREFIMSWYVKPSICTLVPVLALGLISTSVGVASATWHHKPTTTATATATATATTTAATTVVTTAVTTATTTATATAPPTPLPYAITETIPIVQEHTDTPSKTSLKDTSSHWEERTVQEKAQANYYSGSQGNGDPANKVDFPSAPSKGVSYDSNGTGLHQDFKLQGVSFADIAKQTTSGGK